MMRDQQNVKAQRGLSAICVAMKEKVMALYKHNAVLG
jgi:hypothetical protein